MTRPIKGAEAKKTSLDITTQSTDLLRSFLENNETFIKAVQDKLKPYLEDLLHLADQDRKSLAKFLVNSVNLAFEKYRTETLVQLQILELYHIGSSHLEGREVTGETPGSLLFNASFIALAENRNALIKSIQENAGIGTKG